MIKKNTKNFSVTSMYVIYIALYCTTFCLTQPMYNCCNKNSASCTHPWSTWSLFKWKNRVHTVNEQREASTVIPVVSLGQNQYFYTLGNINHFKSRNHNTAFVTKIGSRHYIVFLIFPKHTQFTQWHGIIIIGY